MVRMYKKKIQNIFLVIYVLALFLYIADVLASADIDLSKKKKRRSKKKEKEKLISKIEAEYKYLIFVPIMHFKSGRIVLPSTRYADIGSADEKKLFLDSILNLNYFLSKRIMFLDLATEYNSFSMSISEMRDYYEKYEKNIENIFLSTVNIYIRQKQSYKELLDNLMYELFSKNKIAQNYVNEGIEILSNLQNKIKLIRKKKRDKKEPLFIEEENLYLNESMVNSLLNLYNLVHDTRKDIEHAAELQNQFGECINARFTIASDFQSMIPAWFIEENQNMDSIFFIALLNRENYRIFNYAKNNYSPEVAGELIIYAAINKNNILNWKGSDIISKLEDISTNLKKREKDLAKLIFDENKEKRLKKANKAQNRQRVQVERDNSDTTEDKQEDQDEIQAKIGAQLQEKKEQMNQSQLPFESIITTKLYTFHSRVARWSVTNLERIQESLNHSSNAFYYKQPRDKLLLAKYLHDIFPVVRILSSEYRGEFFSESKNAFNGKTYTAEGVMVIKELEDESKKKIIRGQVEIGFDREKKNMIYHLYFKPTSEETYYSSEKEMSSQEIGYEEIDTNPEDVFLFIGSPIYAAEFIGKKEEGNITIVFPRTCIPGHPIVERTLFLSRKKHIHSKRENRRESKFK
ncbi:hypothetical protein NEFER01_2242 [Nematocida sp. LUAm1]|nr:hypothetical protein NEFER02_2246 [Nematocida sp. LUAm2]KAI5179423.1 hypothetical protein NEFER01_2242 [Nematocida sp. LUAm1]